MDMLIASLAPVVIILLYIYYRDKYEREPWRMLLWAITLGGLIIPAVIAVEGFFSLSTPEGQIPAAAYTAYIVAALSEEGFKYLAFMLFIWKSKHFNEKFDGIVYASFISLGFAGIENIMYVMQGGMEVAYSRALTAVPAHALFGVIMGYYLGLAKFFPKQRMQYLVLALLYPILFHGFYDFCLMSEHYLLMLLFIPFVVFMWIIGLKKMKKLSNSSIYRNDF